MASVTKNNDGKDPMAEGELERKQGGQREPRGPVTAPSAEGGFFAIRKRGQGYWTRICSAGGAALILLLTADFIFHNVLAHVQSAEAKWGIVVAFLAVSGLLCWYVMNRPGAVDFLIATDSEMKKVNWTTREELIGSTKVIILFMILMAVFLFGVDLFFGYFFYFIDVLKSKPI